MPRVYPPLEASGQTNQQVSSSPLVESFAGFTGGVVSTLAAHPFDVIKTRLQVNWQVKSKWGDSWRTLKGIYKNEGAISGLYRGLMPNMIGNSISWALYFAWYGMIKDAFQSFRGAEMQLTPGDYFLASGASGILTAGFSNPIWVIKTRMLSTGKDAPGAYRSISHGAKDIWQTEGLRGFYRGLTPSLFGVSHGAIQFMAYEELKNKWSVTRGGRDKLNGYDFVFLSALGKMFAGTITYPYQVLRARLQISDGSKTYLTARELIKQIWKNEGPAGFYRGLGPNLARVVPSTCVTFLVYEETKRYLPRLLADKDDRA